MLGGRDLPGTGAEMRFMGNWMNRRNQARSGKIAVSYEEAWEGHIVRLPIPTTCQVGTT